MKIKAWHLILAAVAYYLWQKAKKDEAMTAAAIAAGQGANITAGSGI